MRCKPTIIHTKHVLRYWVVPQLCVLICCIVQQFSSYCMSEKVPNWLKFHSKALFYSLVTYICNPCFQTLSWRLLDSCTTYTAWNILQTDTHLTRNIWELHACLLNCIFDNHLLVTFSQRQLATISNNTDWGWMVIAQSSSFLHIQIITISVTWLAMQ